MRGGLYRLAVYGGVNLGLDFTDQGGSTGGFITANPTYFLPGLLGRDYGTFINRVPFNLGGGTFGFQINMVDGWVTGLQIAGPVPLPAAAWMGFSLLYSIGVVGTVQRRLRRSA